MYLEGLIITESVSWPKTVTKKKEHWKVQVTEKHRIRDLKDNLDYCLYSVSSACGGLCDFIKSMKLKVIVH